MSTKNIFIYSLTLFAILFAIGCERIETQIIDKTDEAADGIGKIGNVVTSATTAEWGTDKYIIKAATVEGDILSINVSYSGGCETHEFTLVAEPAFRESSPVQLWVSLAHNANGDTCEALLTEAYHFDLTPIKQVYQTGYQTDEGTIVLNLKDAPPGELFYDF